MTDSLIGIGKSSGSSRPVRAIVLLNLDHRRSSGGSVSIPSVLSSISIESIISVSVLGVVSSEDGSDSTCLGCKRSRVSENKVLVWKKRLDKNNSKVSPLNRCRVVGFVLHSTSGIVVHLTLIFCSKITCVV